jgi:hypothetical protein
MRIATIHLLLLFSSLSVCAQTVGKGTVTGRVTADGKGVSGLVLTVWRQPFNSPDGIGVVSAKTDSEGKYRLELPPGSYYASAEGAGFYEIENGTPSLQLRTLTVLPGEASSNLDFEVVRGGVITGKVTNADNAPVVEIPVMLLPLDKQAAALSERSSPRATNWRSDDRGIYRLYGLTPGRYRLAVGENFGAYSVGRSGVAYRRTFHPGTFEEAKATIVEIKPGTVLTDFDLKLAPPEPVFSIRGKVVDEESGLPIADIACAVDSFEAGKPAAGLSGMNFTNKRGEFTIDNIPAGRYAISVPSMLYVGNMPTPNYFGDSAQFDVVDQAGIVIKASRAASVFRCCRNRRRVEQKAPGATAKCAVYRCLHAVSTRQSFGQGFYCRTRPHFFVEGLRPGKLSIYPNSPGTGESNFFKMIRTDLQGVPQKEPIELKAGAQITDLKLVLVYAPGGLRGSVKSASGPLAGNLRGTVMLYRDKEQVAWSLVDGSGNFLLDNVPAGVYRMVVNVQLPGPTPASAHSEQTVKVNDKISDVVVLLDPKPDL